MGTIREKRGMCTRICLRPAAFASASRSSVRCLLSVPGTESKLRNEAYDGVAVVIGGSRGIGLAFTCLLLDESKFRGHVFVLSRSPAASAERCALANHQRCTVVQADITNEASVEAAAATVKHASKHIDLLLNTAGM